MQRPLDTYDTDSDWAFDDVVDSAADVDAYGNPYIDLMVVMNNRAQLWISSNSYTTSMSAPRETTDRSADGWANP